MKFKMQFLVATLAVITFLFSCGNSSEENVNSIADYGFKINNVNKKILSNFYNEGNVLFSNAGIMEAFHMVLNATNGETKSQVEKFINGYNINQNSSAVNTYNYLTFNSLINGVTLKKEYADYLKNDKLIKADIFEIGNDKTAKEIAKLVNDKVSNATNGQLKDVVDEKKYGDPAFVAEIANVIHFKGSWKDADDNGFNTSDYDFKNYNGEKVARKFIIPDTDNCDLIENNSIIGFSLNYAEDDERYKFVALLPKSENFNIYALDLLNLDYFHDAEYMLDVKFPAFEFDNEISLKDILISEGVKDIFDGNVCDLSNGFNVSANNIYVNDCKQNAKIRVDEFGTEASAHTSMGIMLTSAFVNEYKKVRRVSLTFNRPFIYMIYDNVNEMPLFIGANKQFESIGEEIVNDLTDPIVDEIVEVPVTAKTKK